MAPVVAGHATRVAALGKIKGDEWEPLQCALSQRLRGDCVHGRTPRTRSVFPMARSVDGASYSASGSSNARACNLLLLQSWGRQATAPRNRNRSIMSRRGPGKGSKRGNGRKRGRRRLDRWQPGGNSEAPAAPPRSNSRATMIAPGYCRANSGDRARVAAAPGASPPPQCPHCSTSRGPVRSRECGSSSMRASACGTI